MRASDLKDRIKLAFTVNNPLMIHGSPGIGKSDIVNQAAAESGYDHVEDLRLSQLDQVDLRGVPAVVDGLTTWNPPEFLVLKPKSVLFLDEINSAASGVFAAVYQLVLNRRIGNLRLPDDCRIIAAGNLSTDFALVNQMPTPLKNRFSHVTLDVNNDDWTEWAVSAGIHETVIGFLRFRPTMLNEFDASNKTVESKNKNRNMREATAFATPRTWEVMSNYQHLPGGIPASIEYDTYCGIVGEPAAAEFVGYKKYYANLPDLDNCIANPKTAYVPSNEPASLYAVATGLGLRATPKNMDGVIAYLERIPKEFAVLGIKDAIRRNEENAYAKAFTAWSVKNAYLLQ